MLGSLPVVHAEVLHTARQDGDSRRDVWARHRRSIEEGAKQLAERHVREWLLLVGWLVDVARAERRADRLAVSHAEGLQHVAQVVLLAHGDGPGLAVVLHLDAETYVWAAQVLHLEALGDGLLERGHVAVAVGEDEEVVHVDGNPHHFATLAGAAVDAGVRGCGDEVLLAHPGVQRVVPQARALLQPIQPALEAQDRIRREDAVDGRWLDVDLVIHGRVEERRVDVHLLDVHATRDGHGEHGADGCDGSRRSKGVRVVDTVDLGVALGNPARLVLDHLALVVALPPKDDHAAEQLVALGKVSARHDVVDVIGLHCRKLVQDGLAPLLRVWRGKRLLDGGWLS